MLQFSAQIFRNRYILYGFEASIKLRRILVGALYDKVVRLSVKSMTETNSGKLISLISADLFQIERGMSFFPVVIAAPFVNIAAYTILAFTVGWQYMLIVIGCWFVLMMMQWCAGNCSRSLQKQQSRVNDERLKLVNDMIVGCRTIKCYGWEKHFIKKISELREEQQGYVYRLNIIQSFGTSFF